MLILSCDGGMSMGVYIDMEMPKSCDKCSFFAWKLVIGNHCALCPDVTFHVIIDGFDVSYERNGKCPLIEVPEPHGRLIEKSALLDKCYQHYEDFMMRKVDGKTALLNIEKEIKAAPIVIPTSKEGEA